MDPILLAKRKWTEIKFWSICNDLNNLFGDSQILMNFIDNLRNVGNFNTRDVQQMAFENISQIKHKPDQKEIILIMTATQHTKSEIIKKLCITSKRYSAIIEMNLLDPITYTLYYGPEDHRDIIHFLNAYNKIRKAGLE